MGSIPMALVAPTVLLALAAVRMGSLAVSSHDNPEEVSMTRHQSVLLRKLSLSMWETLWAVGVGCYLGLVALGYS
jgi:hypothetical protein